MANLIPINPFDFYFDALAEDQLERWRVPGMSIGVVDGEKTSFKAYGFASVPDKRMEPKSIFPTCGTTKAFTAAVMSMAIDRSQYHQSPIQWSTRIHKMLPGEFVLSDQRATAVTTIEDVLSHRSGLPNLQIAGAVRDSGMSIQETTRRLRHVQLAHAPGHRHFNYSDESYQVISLLLERHMSRPLRSVLRRYLWGPLDINDTYFSVEEVRNTAHSAPRLVQGYTWSEDRRQNVPEPYVDHEAASGASAGFSSAPEYAKWLRCLLFETAPLSPAGHRAMKDPHTVIQRGTCFDHFLSSNQDYHLYTLGWFLDIYQGEQLYWHTGSRPGASIIVGFVPSLQFGFTIMANSQLPQSGQVALCSFLLDRRLGKFNPADGTVPFIGDTLRQEPSCWDHLRNRLSHSLPLEGYEGTYEHPGYGEITIVVQNNILRSDMMNRVCHCVWRLTHAFKEYFFVEQDTVGGQLGHINWLVVEFDVGAHRAERLSLYMQPDFPGEKIPFKRVQGERIYNFFP